ncbi:MAG TPA: DUF167 domain-containing protein [Nitrososphaera sp.]|nr:DUF167 domain-containing protein [Nitrososphaera sp.]
MKFGPDDLFIIRGNDITLSIKSAPERGKANAELMKKLSRHFEVDPSRIRLVSGRTSRKKVIEIL